MHRNGNSNTAQVFKTGSGIRTGNVPTGCSDADMHFLPVLAVDAKIRSSLQYTVWGGSAIPESKRLYRTSLPECSVFYRTPRLKHEGPFWSKKHGEESAGGDRIRRVRSSVELTSEVNATDVGYFQQNWPDPRLFPSSCLTFPPG